MSDFVDTAVISVPYSIHILAALPAGTLAFTPKLPAMIVASEASDTDIGGTTVLGVVGAGVGAGAGLGAGAGAGAAAGAGAGAGAGAAVATARHVSGITNPLKVGLATPSILPDWMTGKFVLTPGPKLSAVPDIVYLLPLMRLLKEARKP